VLVGLDGCEVHLTVIRVPVCPVCVPGSPGVFVPVAASVSTRILCVELEPLRIAIPGCARVVDGLLGGDGDAL
jgi:hypothetical protein